MRTIELDWEGEAHVRVTIIAGAGRVTHRIIDSRDEAEFYANAKAGARGVVISRLDMTPEQRSAHEARVAKLRALAATFRAGAA